MTEFLADTPSLGRPWCPGCQPDADPLREILETRYCGTHVPRVAGSADPPPSDRYLGGSVEAGEDGAAWAELFHRKARLLRGA